MIQNKLIRAKNGNENTSNFTTYLDPPIVLSENSAIALQSFNMELTPNVIDITSETQTLAYATVKPNTASYNALITEHTFTIPVNTYSTGDLSNVLTLEANKKLFCETVNNHSREQGAEIKFYHNEAENKISFIWAGRQASEFCGTPISKVSQTDSTGNSYEYTLVVNPVNTPPKGTVKRLTASATEFDFYEYSTIPFCRGSGQTTIDVTGSITNYVIGLINPLHLLSNPSSNDILQKMRYGIMLLDNTSTYDINDFPQDKLLIKDGEESAWDEMTATTTDEIKFILGKQTAYLGNGYSLFIEWDASYISLEYEYGDYVLICATYTQNNILSYQITETKLGSSATTEKGYYPTINPEYINMPNDNFISLENISYNDDGLGFIPNRPGSYIILNMLNGETQQLYGFTNNVMISNEIFASPNNVINITPEFRVNARYQFPDTLKLVVDLPLDCYDNGKNENILCFVPNNISQQYLTYQPSPPVFITLKNNKSLYLDHISFKLYDSNNILLPNQVSSSAILILQSIK